MKCKQCGAELRSNGECPNITVGSVMFGFAVMIILGLILAWLIASTF